MLLLPKPTHRPKSGLEPRFLVFCTLNACHPPPYTTFVWLRRSTYSKWSVSFSQIIIISEHNPGSNHTSLINFFFFFLLQISRMNVISGRQGWFDQHCWVLTVWTCCLLSHPFLHSRERQRESSRLLYSYIPSVEAGIQKYRNTICDTNNSPGVGKSLRFNCSFSFTTHNDTNLVHLSDVLSLIYCIHAFKTF